MLQGQLVVGDAACCDREICGKITAKEGDYLVLVKDNQPQLHQDAQQACVVPRSFSPPTAGVGPMKPVRHIGPSRRAGAASRSARSRPRPLAWTPATGPA